MIDRAILDPIKAGVLQVVPFAKVMLFGSRAYGQPHEESDWDILVLTAQPVNAALKRQIRDALFPIAVRMGTFINTLVVQEDDWQNNPSYYSLHMTIDKRMVAL